MSILMDLYERLKPAIPWSKVEWNETRDSSLGRGSYGEVFSGVADGQQLAVKKWFGGLKTVREQQIYMREVEISRVMRHPALLSLLSYSISPVATVTPRLATDIGEILKLTRRGQPLPQYGGSRIVWNATKQSIAAVGVASAMEFLHRHNVIHRDLKPANVIVDGRSWPRVGDFGFARILSTGPEVVDAAALMSLQVGSPLYNAPELNTNTESYTRAVDVYAYGILLYEVLTGRTPFEERGKLTLFQLQSLVDRGERPLLPDSLPPALRDLVRRCWSHQPVDRPTFAQIVQELNGPPSLVLPGTDAREYGEYLSFISRGTGSA